MTNRALAKAVALGKPGASVLAACKEVDGFIASTRASSFNKQEQADGRLDKGPGRSRAYPSTKRPPGVPLRGGRVRAPGPRGPEAHSPPLDGHAVQKSTPKRTPQEALEKLAWSVRRACGGRAAAGGGGGWAARRAGCAPRPPHSQRKRERKRKCGAPARPVPTYLSFLVTPSRLLQTWREAWGGCTRPPRHPAHPQGPVAEWGSAARPGAPPGPPPGTRTAPERAGAAEGGGGRRGAAGGLGEARHAEARPPPDPER